MSGPVLTVKLNVPPCRSDAVLRSTLMERLDKGVNHGLTLISAPAGFGKTTLLSTWIHNLRLRSGRAAWLTLDREDSDPVRFLTYLVWALRTVSADLGAEALPMLQSSQSPSVETVVTSLLNDIAVFRDDIILVLDDYHAVHDTRAAGPTSVDKALVFLADHLPPRMRLVIATREDPPLPLSRLRARGMLAELRTDDLRFSSAESADFLNRTMNLSLLTGDISVLEARTEGWVAGLQLAALAIQGRTEPFREHKNVTGFIQSFTGSHRFIMDYLIEEVLHRQTADLQTFLLRTSILDRMSAPLCAAVLGSPIAAVQKTLEFLEHANLFIVPLDSDRLWYRYHQLFRELLRRRLDRVTNRSEIASSHLRASVWFESSGLMLESFRHATEAGDIDRAERLIESRTMGLHVRSVAVPILDWLEALPESVLDSRPLLRVRSATLSLMIGRTTGVEEKLQAAEAAFAVRKGDRGYESNENARDLTGQIACARATLALTRYDPEAMISQAHRAVEFLHADNLEFRFTASWALASAYLFLGDCSAATGACMECIEICRKSGNIFSTILAESTLGEIQERENRLHKAAGTYRRVLELYGGHPQPNAGDVHLGLARILYEWNDLASAEHHAFESLRLTRLYDRVIDRFIVSEVFLARLKLARGDTDGAAELIAETERTALRNDFLLRMPEIAAMRSLVLLRRGDPEAAAELARQHDLRRSLARALIAQGKPDQALEILESLRQGSKAERWEDERLSTLVLQALALHSCGHTGKAVSVLDRALSLAEPEGCIRTFADEGGVMRSLIANYRIAMKSHANARNTVLFSEVLMSACAQSATADVSTLRMEQTEITQPLSPRELEILGLIAEGLTNEAIAGRLFLSLHTVKAHLRNIFGKLGVANRTEAAARAREHGLLP